MKRIVSFCSALLVLAALIGGAEAHGVDYNALFGAPYTQQVDSAFTFAFVGDTQEVTFRDNEKLGMLYDWLLEIREEKNLKFVAGLGDMTDTSATWEWKAAVEAVRKLDGVVPYSLIRGNHDSNYAFVKNVNYESYTKNLAGMYKNVLNTYHLVEVGSLKYLFLNLDYGPADDVLDWACGIVEQHPAHNVIITTHGYIGTKGQLLAPGNTTYPPSETHGVNDGPEIWNRLVRKYPNIVMVVCGHVGSEHVIWDYGVIGDHGNKIRHVLIDPQNVDLNAGSAGIVSLFHFSADGKKVQVENYATLRKQHYGSGTVFELSSMGGDAHAVTAPAAEAVPATTGEPEPPAEAQPDNRTLMVCCAAVVLSAGVVAAVIRKRKSKEKTV